MKRLFQISFVLFSLFRLNGNDFLYAHTNQANEIVSEYISLELEEGCTIDAVSDSEITNLSSISIRIPVLQSDSFPTSKKKSKRFKFSIFEKEEKEKEDKQIVTDSFSKDSFSFSPLFSTPLFDRFYHYNKNYLDISEDLNYFLFYRCYILFQVFRL